MNIEEFNRTHWTHCANLAKEFNKRQWEMIRLTHLDGSVVQLNNHPNFIVSDLLKLSNYIIDFAVTVIDDKPVFPGDKVYFKFDSTPITSYIVLENQTSLPQCLRLVDVKQHKILTAHREGLTLTCPEITVKLSSEERDIIFMALALEYYPINSSREKDVVKKIKEKLEL